MFASALSMLVICLEIQDAACGCRYSNPVWVEDDRTAPEIRLLAGNDTSSRFGAKWNNSLIGKKTILCIDQVQLWARLHDLDVDSSRQLCSVDKKSPLLSDECFFDVDRDDPICGEAVDFWLILLNENHFSEAVQIIKSPGVTRISKFHCGLEDLGKEDSAQSSSEVVRSETCESLPPRWIGRPNVQVTEASVTISWSESDVDHVDCVDMFEIKHWQSGAFVPRQRVQDVENSPDVEETLEDIVHCKKYTVVVKAIQRDPYYATSSQQTFEAFCDPSARSNARNGTASNGAESFPFPREIKVSNVLQISRNTGSTSTSASKDAKEEEEASPSSSTGKASPLLPPLDSAIDGRRENSARAMQENGDPLRSTASWHCCFSESVGVLVAASLASLFLI